MALDTDTFHPKADEICERISDAYYEQLRTLMLESNVTIVTAVQVSNPIAYPETSGCRRNRCSSLSTISNEDRPL